MTLSDSKTHMGGWKRHNAHKNLTTQQGFVRSGGSRRGSAYGRSFPSSRPYWSGTRRIRELRVDVARTHASIRATCARPGRCIISVSSMSASRSPASRFIVKTASFDVRLMSIPTSGARQADVRARIQGQNKPGCRARQALEHFKARYYVGTPARGDLPEGDTRAVFTYQLQQHLGQRQSSGPAGALTQGVACRPASASDLLTVGQPAGTTDDVATQHDDASAR